MRPPLNIPLFIRNKKDDAKRRGQPGIKHLLHSPYGGAYGMVRSEKQQGHQGWDIYAAVNTPIVAIAKGKIVKARRYRGYGQSVILSFQHPDYPDGLYAMYAHLSKISVSVGQPVEEGETLGYTGTDGNAHGQPPHLHFEIRTIAEPVIPDSKEHDHDRVLHGRINPGRVLGGHYNL